ncbi:hypothetical protein C8Q76DRAFT_442322 [Earliella scabrosa]|nr:hypothetical protein C8Q76DRAFT_442322 [Earliella scabrosa]
MFSKVAVLYILAFVVLFASAAVVDQEKRDIGDVFDSIVDGGKSVFEDVKTVVESVGGEAFTVITAAGGQAFTLAQEGAGVVTSIGDQVYTIATAEIAKVTGDDNAALGMHSISLSTPLLGGLLMVLSSIFMGAWVAL